MVVKSTVVSHLGPSQRMTTFGRNGKLYGVDVEQIVAVEQGGGCQYATLGVYRCPVEHTDTNTGEVGGPADILRQQANNFAQIATLHNRLEESHPSDEEDLVTAGIFFKTMDMFNAFSAEILRLRSFNRISLLKLQSTVAPPQIQKDEDVAMMKEALVNLTKENQLLKDKLAAEKEDALRSRLEAARNQKELEDAVKRQKEDFERLMKYRSENSSLPEVHWASLTGLCISALEALAEIHGYASFTQLVRLDGREMENCGLTLFAQIFSSITVAPIHLALIQGHVHVANFIYSKYPLSLYSTATTTAGAEMRATNFPSQFSLLELASFKSHACYERALSWLGSTGIVDENQYHLTLKMALLGGNHELLDTIQLPNPIHPFLQAAASGGNISSIKQHSGVFKDDQAKILEIACAGIHHVPILELVLEMDARLNYNPNLIGRMALEASRRGATAGFQFLYEHPLFDPSFQDDHGWTAAHYACMFGRLEILAILLGRGKDQPFWGMVTTGKLWTLAHVAAKYDHLEVLIWLRDVLGMAPKTAGEWHPLIYASSSLEVVKWLCETFSVDLEARTKKGNQAVHLAARAGNLPLLNYLVSVLGESCLNSAGFNKTRPAHWAVLGEDPTVTETTLKWLNQNGANFALRCGYGRTVAHDLAKKCTAVSGLEFLTWLKDNSPLKLTEHDNRKETVFSLLLSHPYASTVEFRYWVYLIQLAKVPP